MFSAGFGLDAVEWGISNVGYNWRIGCLAVYRFGQVQSKIRVVISLLLFGCFASWVLFCAELKFFVSVEFNIHYVSIFFRLKMLSFFFFVFLSRNCFSKCDRRFTYYLCIHTVETICRKMEDGGNVYPTIIELLSHFV